MSQSTINIEMLKERLQRRLARAYSMKEKLEAKHSGKEMWLTYHAGFDMGYLIGQISVLEQMEDSLINNEEENSDGSEESRT
jgi:hypothetical protein